ncbi:MAG: toprim domain-containing protein [Acidaminococcaceae bacterium]|nr:toprim domain-containing protein [Acidaminococcaceae bacterium]
MDRRTATEEIKARWQDVYPADGNGRGKGIICPLCGSGSGKHGTGITEYKKSGNHFLKCWNGGCSFEGGSVIDLYMLDRHMNPETDFGRAVDELAARLGIAIDPPTSERPTVTVKGESVPSLNGTSTNATKPADNAPQQPADFTAYYEQCGRNLAESTEAQAYLQRRGISLEIAEQYSIGFDPAWISPEVRRKQQEKGSDWLPDPKPVLILPSTRGHYVARDIRPAAQLDEQQRKHQKMNEGTPGIFGSDIAFSSDAENIFITEGAFDALSILEAGETAIALNSTSNADKLLEQLEQHPTKATLILCLDNDDSGRKTTEKLKAGLTRLNISWITADICGGHKDPNEALTADRATFIQAVKRAFTSRPDNTSLYISTLMDGELVKFKKAQERLTGFANLDEKAGGLNAGLYILAAISSLGKTTLALQTADQLAAAGHEVIFFSLEQSRLELVTKSLARLTAQADMKTAVSSLSIRRGDIPSQVVKAVGRYKEQIGERLSIVEGNFNCDLGFIADYIRRYRERTGITPICFIDYLQIIQPAAEGKSHSSKREEVDLAVTELKRLSRELDLTLIVISAVNRNNYLTPIAFESLKESGGIEYGSDVVWGLQLECLDNSPFDKEGCIADKREAVNRAKAENPRRIKLVCLKNRYGISSFDCSFDYYPQFDLFVPSQTTDYAALLKNSQRKKR